MRRLTLLAATAGVVVGISSHAFAATGQQAFASQSLNRQLPEVKFTGSTLKDSFDFLRDVSGANIHVNWRALEAAGVTGDTQVNVRLRDVPLHKVLTVLLNEAGVGLLTYYTSDGVIEVTTAELADKEMVTKVYPVDDLIMEVPDFDNAPSFSLEDSQGSGGSGGSSGGSRGGGGGGSSGFTFGGNGGTEQKEKTKTKTERADELVTMIRETIRPDIWREAGGPASIRYYNGNLVVTAPRSVHEALGGPFE
jgi:uncharacterized membrane protein YgcG